MIYLLVGHRARLPIVVRKEALLYYQIVAVVALGYVLVQIDHVP